jgi:hypothetical protein
MEELVHSLTTKSSAVTTIRDLGSWYWFLTLGSLGVGLFSWPMGLYQPMASCAVQIGHEVSFTRDLTALPGQVRVSYLAILMAGLWGPLYWIPWMLLAATSARVLAGCCRLGRMLSLALWNRWQPMSFALIRRTFLSLEAAVTPCGEVFRRRSLERVQG